MTLAHKIKLIFCRIGWWLRITEKSRKHYEALQDYYYLYDLYNKITSKFIEMDKVAKNSAQTYKLKGQIELLATILDIKQ